MNLHMWVTFSGDHTTAKLVASFATSLPFDVAHADRQRHLLPGLRARAGPSLAPLPHALRHHLAPACPAKNSPTARAGPWPTTWTARRRCGRTAKRSSSALSAARSSEFADATFEFARSLRALGRRARRRRRRRAAQRHRRADRALRRRAPGRDRRPARHHAARADELHELVPHADLRILIAEAEHADALRITDAPELRHVVRHGPGENPECISWEELKALSTDVPAAEVRRVQRRMRASETAMIVYAPPGTTDRPTGCRLTHEGLVRSARVLGEQRFPMTEEDRQFNPLPLVRARRAAALQRLPRGRRGLRRHGALQRPGRAGAADGRALHGRLPGRRPAVGRGPRPARPRGGRPLEAVARRRRRRRRSC